MLLWIAALLCFVPGVELPQLGLAIFTVIIINGLFAFWQEHRSDRALEMLQDLIARKSRVIRDGEMSEIDASELVPGDVILLEEGDLVPADARLLEAFEVEVDNSAAEVSEMDDRRLRDILAQGETIFARVAPEHKLRIVSLLKEMGEVVAVNGDGVNDAPALKKADIGIAMGRRGNDVAKEAARMILTDDNFSSIVAAIEEGRAMFENIKRFAACVFNSNPQEIYPYLIWVLFPGIPLAMTVMGVLAVDVGTDLIPAMGLGTEPPEEGIMERPPRRREEKLLSLNFILRSYFVQGSLLAVSCYASYFYMGWVIGAYRPGASLSSMPAAPPGLKLGEASPAHLQTLTAYFFPTVTTQIGNVLCKRSWTRSLFARDFLSPGRRHDCLRAIAGWRPLRFAGARTAHPCRSMLRLSRFFEQHHIRLNFVSNPLVDLGILFELGLCYVFFYTPLSKIYYFAPLPWHVYLFACHGTLLILVFEETKKYFRRRGYSLEYLG